MVPTRVSIIAIEWEKIWIMKIRCPYCKSSYHVEDEFEGQTIPCPGCDNLFRIIPEGRIVFNTAPPKKQNDFSFFDKNKRMIIAGVVTGTVLLTAWVLYLVLF